MAQYFTKQGLEKLKKELHELKTKEVKRVTKLIAEAAAFGDLSENSAYHEARDMKSFLLGRIEQLENAINEAVVVEKEATGNVQIGSRVTILFGGAKETYLVVSPSEAEVLKNKISYQSPLGATLMGKKAGDKFDYQAGKKKVAIKVLEVN